MGFILLVSTQPWWPAVAPGHHPPQCAAVLSAISAPRVHPGKPAQGNRPAYVSASCWGTRQASAQQKSPLDVAHWAPVRSASSA